MHPEYQQKVYEEIENNLSPDQTTVTADVIGQLSHTDRLIKETLRLFPTIPLITRITRCDMKLGRFRCYSETFSANNSISIVAGKYDIPTGTEFILSIFDLHRKPSIWGPAAGNFDPNNFLPENVAQRHPHSFVPFSFGARNCVGKTKPYALLCWKRN